MEVIVVDVNKLTRRWWVLLLRGAAAFVFGIFTLWAPAISLASLILVFGAWATVDGIMALVGAVGRGRHEEEQFWGQLLHGIAGVALGLITLFAPGLTALALVYLIAAWAAVIGAFEIVTAVRMRQLIEGEWLMIVTGIVAIAFGILIALRPGSGALALTVWIGGFGLVTGVLLVALSLRLRAWAHKRDIPVATGHA